MTPTEYRAALKELIDADFLRSLTSKYAQGGDREDIAQDVLLRLCTLEPQQAANIRDLRSYAGRLVRNCVIDLAVRRARAPILLGGDSLLVFGEMHGALEQFQERPEDPLELIQQAERLAILREVLGNLTPLEREVIELLLEGQSIPQLAHRLQLGLHVVRQAAEHGLKKLRELTDSLLSSARPGRSENGQ